MSGWQQIVNFDDYGALLSLVHNTLIGGAVLGVVAGLVSTFVMMRDLPFAVHGISELSFAGAEGFLLAGWSVVGGAVTGSLLAALIIGTLGRRARDRNSIIGVLMPFGLGLGVLFLSLYKGRSVNKFGVLFGQIAAVSTTGLTVLVVTSAVVLVGLGALWRPLRFSSTDPELAEARGVPVRFLSIAFMLLLGLTVAMSVQIVGALLVLSIVCTPAAAAMHVTASPTLAPVLSVIFAVTAMVGGTLLALGGTIPISPYVTTISFVIYVACRCVGAARMRRGWAARAVPVPA
jgi:zinc/manganese transport system permease protein